jgi:hypothetical protein
MAGCWGVVATIVANLMGGRTFPGAVIFAWGSAFTAG